MCYVILLATACITALYMQLRREFKSVVPLEYDLTTVMDCWSDWCRKHIEYSKLDCSSRLFIRKIFDTLNENDTKDNGI